MVILKIVPQKYKKNYRSVFIDEKTSFPVHEEVAAKYGLREGMELSEERLDEVRFAASEKEATDHAYMYLNYRALSEGALSDRLKKKGFGPRVVESVVAKLKELKLIDDARLAKDSAESRLKGRLLGDRRVKEDLIRKGIPDSLADEAVREAQKGPAGAVPDEDERAYALLLKRRRQIKAIDAHTLHRRLFEYLSRRGFDPDTIERALSRYRREGGKIDIIGDL